MIDARASVRGGSTAYGDRSGRGRAYAERAVMSIWPCSPPRFPLSGRLELLADADGNAITGNEVIEEGEIEDGHGELRRQPCGAVTT